MGYYVETGGTHEKAAHIISQHDGNAVTESEARELMVSGERDIVIVVNNGMFEAAAFAFSMEEFEAFTYKGDTRPKQFVSLPKGVGASLSGYEK